MSALISVNGQALDAFPRQGEAIDFRDYNDPWDYFGFVMANSSSGSNSDGYGVLTYSNANFPQRQAWYDRVRQSADFGHTYYTGPYFQDSLYTQERLEPLDLALGTALGSSNDVGIALCHARNATGATLGNHPFTFDYLGRTYSFMHNGYSNATREIMISTIRQMNPGYDWFEQHPSNYFGDTDPNRWVDSEVLFHYIMSHIIARGGDTLDGMQRALARIRSYLLNTNSGVYNFVMSDGEKLYVFRSSPLSGPNASYRLSYKSFPGKFYGIRTQAPISGDKELQPRELVVFSHTSEPIRYRDFPQVDFVEDPPITHILRNRLDDVIPGLVIRPNPSAGAAQFKLALSESSDVDTKIFNLKGELVWHFRIPDKPPGIFKLDWDGHDLKGKLVAAGVYLVQVNAGGELHTGKIVRIKN